MPDQPVLLGKPTRANAIYIFADVRGFTAWARDNQEEIDRLLPLIYTLAVEAFGEMSYPAYLRRVVKFLGDGFFAVNEYREDDQDDLKAKLLDTVTAILAFNSNLKKALRASTLHDRNSILMGFGITHGTSRRFSLTNFPIDYAGHQVNLASRLCSIASGGAINLERGLLDYIRQLIASKQIKLKDHNKKSQPINGFGSVKYVEIPTMSSISTSTFETMILSDVLARFKKLAKIVSSQ